MNFSTVRRRVKFTNQNTFIVDSDVKSKSTHTCDTNPNVDDKYCCTMLSANVNSPASKQSLLDKLVKFAMNLIQKLKYIHWVEKTIFVFVCCYFETMSVIMIIF